MCGRYACFWRPDNLEEIIRQSRLRCNKSVDKDKYKPSYNVTPTYYEPVVRCDAQSRENIIHYMKWGLVPSWTKRRSEYASSMKTINARDDSLTGGKPMFSSMKHSKRCIVIVHGFYEWLKKGKEKIPYFTKRQGNEVMFFAGLYDCATFDDDHEESLYTFTIVTTSASKQFSFIHDRMPVILDESQLEKWLDPSTRWNRELTEMLKPYEGELEIYPVNKAVGKAGTDSPSYIVPINSKDSKSSIERYFEKTKWQPTKAADSEQKNMVKSTFDDDDGTSQTTTKIDLKIHEDGLEATPSISSNNSPIGSPNSKKHKLNDEHEDNESSDTTPKKRSRTESTATIRSQPSSPPKKNSSSSPGQKSLKKTTKISKSKTPVKEESKLRKRVAKSEKSPSSPVITEFFKKVDT
ncbi:9856_t:CDS:2 [Ambispora gerdemannii]|uniref:9856_t:CDS:1 n=1 Tax=Ambispora gerdemannii TaxID=144530 RepID=A0A9N9G1F0_9GLOM|nr:9856_t:CDS:2 [Ambispora gerdemannii]